MLLSWETQEVERRGQTRLSGLLVAAVVSVGSVTAPAQAADRILLDRERAEFTAEFFAFTHGSRLSAELHVNCLKRVALNVRRCRLSWEARGELNKARLEVAAFEVSSDRNRYRVKYRLEQTDKRCAATQPPDECTSVERGRETYSGS